MRRVLACLVLSLLTACRSVAGPLVAAQPSPVPVTPTTAPTPTSDPSRLPNGKLRITPEIAEYLGQVQRRLEAYGAASASFEAHVEQVDGNTALLTDADWKRQALAHLDAFDAAGDELGTITPVPDAVKEIDEWFKLIEQSTHKMVADYEKGVTELDVQHFRTAATREAKIAEWITEALAQLDQFDAGLEFDTRLTDL